MWITGMASCCAARMLKNLDYIDPLNPWFEEVFGTDYLTSYDPETKRKAKAWMREHREDNMAMFHLPDGLRADVINSTGSHLWCGSYLNDNFFEQVERLRNNEDFMEMMAEGRKLSPAEFGLTYNVFESDITPAHLYLDSFVSVEFKTEDSSFQQRAAQELAYINLMYCTLPLLCQRYMLYGVTNDDNQKECVHALKRAGWRNIIKEKSRNGTILSTWYLNGELLPNKYFKNLEKEGWLYYYKNTWGSNCFVPVWQLSIKDMDYSNKTYLTPFLIDWKKKRDKRKSKEKQ